MKFHLHEPKQSIKLTQNVSSGILVFIGLEGGASVLVSDTVFELIRLGREVLFILGIAIRWSGLVRWLWSGLISGLIRSLVLGRGSCVGVFTLGMRVGSGHTRNGKNGKALQGQVRHRTQGGQGFFQYIKEVPTFMIV